MLELSSLAYAFTVGMAAAFNPCGAAMFPAYVGYQLGSVRSERNPLSSGARAVVLGLSATAGFIVVFGTVGIVLAAGGRVIGKFLPFAGLGIGILIAATGLWLLFSGRHIGIMAASRVNLGQGRGIRNVFLFGIAYAIASLSCALPLFLVAVGIIAGQTLSAGGVTETIVGTVTYGLGMGTVIVAATVGIVFFKDLVSRGMRAVFPIVEPVGKLAMVGAGAYLIYYWTAGKGSELLVLRAEQLF
jgi:cytochrome c biogenesis protein CcdA